MRKLADYAFMLRDFKLASATYELLRGDFDNDKAWKYYAGANEMAAISMLLNTPALTPKTRAETLDRMFEAATHSYIHRCIAPYYALRTLTLGAELLALRGSLATDDAARWAAKGIEYGLVGLIGHTLVTERICSFYSSRDELGSMAYGSRRRKAAFWASLASEAFLKLGKTLQSDKCLTESCRLYAYDLNEGAGLNFGDMRAYLEELRSAIVAAKLADQGYEDGEDVPEVAVEAAPVEEVSEQLDTRKHRHSLIGTSAPFAMLDNAPLSPARIKDDPLRLAEIDDAFE